MKYFYRHALTIAAFTIISFAASLAGPAAQAQDSGLFPPPAQAENNTALTPIDITHPPLRLTPDRSEIVDLPEPIGRIIVGNDANANILMDNAQRIVVVPRAIGATFFTILDQDGQVIMQRHVIVGSPRENYVRVRRSCSAGSDGCNPIETFYCADMCHMITQQEVGGESTSGGAHGSVTGGGAYGGELPPEFYESGYRQNEPANSEEQ